MSKSFFSDVDDSKDTWSVVAKVLRKWVVRKKAAPYPIWKIGMILVDEMESTIEVSATHKNLIPKLLDDPKEEMVYNFQNFEVVENDDKYRVTSNLWKFNFHTYTFIEESDVVINKEAYNFKPIVDIRTGNYGHLSNAFNATLVTVNPNIPEASLLKERLSQDSVSTQMFSQISNAEYPTYSAESLLTFHTRVALSEISNLDKECDVVSKVTIRSVKHCMAGFMMHVLVKLRIKDHNIKHRTSSIGVSQMSADIHLGQQFQYSNVEEQTTNIPEESTASRQTAHTSSQTYVIEDDINNLTQLTTPQDANTKRKNIADDVPILCGDLGIAEMCTPKLSSTKPVKNIKKEK
ncbi:hypothetical protein K1719_015234 [Acacia pycnantha]|nr:hypothetical protein K1719_015234 [Acacia pycnantha]